MASFASKMLNLTGWSVTGDFPQHRKFIIAVGPHTSNWDFLVGCAVMLKFRVKIKILAKDGLFFWPMSSLMHYLGAIPVARGQKSGLVEQIVERFNQEEQMILGLAPEGTRTSGKALKTGFLHIAHQANIPVMPVNLNFKLKQVELLPAVSISSDIDRELEQFIQYFDYQCAKNPQINSTG